MDISKVVNDQSQSERFLIFFCLPSLLNLLDVCGLKSCLVIFQELGEGIKGIHNFNVSNLKVEVIELTTLVEVWLVDKVPWALPVHVLVFNLISKGCTLCEWVISFRLN
jgi:hypothetical protein